MRTEDSGNRMNKRLIAFAMLALMLLALSGAAGEEEIPATPTDLSCPHEHTKTTIYFYDSPAYIPIDGNSHRVYGPATVETVCEDCGELISAEYVSDAEEIRPHSMKKGACVLCGYKSPVKTEEPRKADRSGTETIVIREDAAGDGVMSLTLSEAELSELNRNGVSTVVARGKDGGAAFVLNVKEALAQAKTAEASLVLELAEREDGSVFAGMYLLAASGKRIQAERGGATLRLYRDQKTGQRVSVASEDSEVLTETLGVWDDRGFWSVPYLNEGTYFILQ